MAGALDMDIPFEYNSMQPLVHRECDALFSKTTQEGSMYCTVGLI
jgi:hypothetical protein